MKVYILLDNENSEDVKILGVFESEADAKIELANYVLEVGVFTEYLMLKECELKKDHSTAIENGPETNTSDKLYHENENKETIYYVPGTKLTNIMLLADQALDHLYQNNFELAKGYLQNFLKKLDGLRG